MEGVLASSRSRVSWSFKTCLLRRSVLGGVLRRPALQGAPGGCQKHVDYVAFGFEVAADIHGGVDSGAAVAEVGPYMAVRGIAAEKNAARAAERGGAGFLYLTASPRALAHRARCRTKSRRLFGLLMETYVLLWKVRYRRLTSSMASRSLPSLYRPWRAISLSTRRRV